MNSTILVTKDDTLSLLFIVAFVVVWFVLLPIAIFKNARQRGWEQTASLIWAAIIVMFPLAFVPYIFVNPRN